MTKSQLREHYLAQRRSLAGRPDEKGRADREISRRVLSLPEIEGCEELLCYVSGRIEVATAIIISESLGKRRVLCPRCFDNTNEMEFCLISGTGDLEKGHFGISEPAKHCEVIRSFSERSVCIVPGLSFDRCGHRLGFGKGFYDRFLSGFPGIRVGLCYDVCICDELPKEEHDLAVDILVTEGRVLRLRPKERKDTTK